MRPLHPALARGRASRCGSLRCQRGACAVLTLQEKKQLVFDGVADGKFAEMTKLSAKDLQFLFRN